MRLAFERSLELRELRVSSVAIESVFICMLACYVRWHLERRWAPLLFHDEQPPLQTNSHPRWTNRPPYSRRLGARAPGAGSRFEGRGGGSPPALMG